MKRRTMGSTWSLASSTAADFQYVVNMGNSIIGVVILAMPWAFKEVGVVLATLLLIVGSILTKWACRLMLSTAGSVAAGPAVLPSSLPKRTGSSPIMQLDHTVSSNSYEYLAGATCGRWAKLILEISIIGYLLGACVTFLVAMGDLMPDLVRRITWIFSADKAPVVNLDDRAGLRALLLSMIAVGIALPLSLMKRIESLVSFSVFSLIFYVLLALKLVFDALYHLSLEDYLSKLTLWNSSNMWAVVPIFATGLSCQTQVFVMYESLPESSPKRMNAIISDAINLCLFLYWVIGFFGYIAFVDTDLKGDVLLNFGRTWTVELIKALYVITAAVSFPLCIFPARKSVETLFFSSQAVTASSHLDAKELFSESAVDVLENAPEVTKNDELSSKLYMAAPAPRRVTRHFTAITIILVMIVLVFGIVIPNVETVLNLSGSTMGAVVCFIMPALIALVWAWRTRAFDSASVKSGVWSSLASLMRNNPTAVVVLSVGLGTMATCLYDVSAVFIFWGLEKGSNLLVPPHRDIPPSNAHQSS